jgi:hypothetical protein
MTAGGAAVRVTLSRAANAAEREAAIEAWLRSSAPAASGGGRVVIAEGALFERCGPQDVPLVGLAPGCPCCAGVLALRVTLARTLRKYRPAALLLLAVSEEHLPRLRQLLQDGELGVRLQVED